MASLQLDKAKSQFLLLKQDISDVPTDTFVQWCQFITDFVYRKNIETTPESYVLTSTFASVTSGAQSLPANFKSISEAGMGFNEVDGSGNMIDRTLKQTWPGAQTRGYFLSAGGVTFTGIENAETFILRYIPKRPSYDDTVLTDYFTIDKTSTGVIIIDDEYTKYILKALDVLYNQWDNDPSSELLADQRFVRALSDLLSDVNPQGAAYFHDDFSSIY